MSPFGANLYTHLFLSKQAHIVLIIRRLNLFTVVIFRIFKDDKHLQFRDLHPRDSRY